MQLEIFKVTGTSSELANCDLKLYNSLYPDFSSVHLDYFEIIY